MSREAFDEDVARQQREELARQKFAEWLRDLKLRRAERGFIVVRDDEWTRAFRRGLTRKYERERDRQLVREHARRTHGRS